MDSNAINRNFEASKTISQFFLASVICILFVGCYGNSQDTPEAVVDTFASSISSMDIESAASCFEYGEEIVAFMSGISGENYDMAALQDVVSAAKESELLPEISYEIIESNIGEDKGSVRVKFTYRFDDGENVNESSDEQVIPVYLHEGQWWIGEGYTKSEREMARRGMKFIENLSKRRGGF